MNLDELKQTIETNDAVMVYFSGENCGVCKALQPKIKELFDTSFQNIEQIYISSNEYMKTAAQFSVLTIPTVIVFFDNKEFVRQSRHISIQELQSKIERPYSLFFE